MFPGYKTVKKRILVVDDDPKFRNRLSDMLQKQSYEIILANSGEDALLQLEKDNWPGGCPVDLMLLDIGLPGINGIEVCRRARQNGMTLPIIMLTVEKPGEKLTHAFSAGANDYVSKPIVNYELQARVEAFLKLRATETALSERNWELEALYDLTSALVETRSVQRVLEAAARHVACTLCAQGAAAVVLDDIWQTSALGAAWGTALMAWEESRNLNLPTGIMADVKTADNGVTVVTGKNVQTEGGVWGQTGSTGLMVALIQDRPNGALIVQCTAEQANSAANERVLSGCAQQVAVALNRAQLLDQTIQGRDQLRHMTERVIQAQEDERRRIARELHDEMEQTLVALKVHVTMVQNLSPGQPGLLHEHLAQAHTLLDTTMDEIDRLVLDLRPSSLDDLGLMPALQSLADRFTRRTGIQVDARMKEITVELPQSLETALYRIVQEALTNVERHAEAQHVRLALRVVSLPIGPYRMSPTKLMLTVFDDGKGFSLAQTLRTAADEGCLGLVGIRERVAMCGGDLVIDTAPRQGTHIEASFVLAELKDSLTEV